MKKLVIIIAVFTLFGCNKSTEMTEQFNYDNGIEFSVFDANNEDLLDTATANHYDVAEIKLFYVINGKTEEVYNQNMDYPRNYKIYKHENEYRIRVFMNHTETSEKPVTYIQWNNNDNDTIEVTYERTSNSVMKSKIWLNEKQIWDRSLDQEEYYLLIK